MAEWIEEQGFEDVEEDEAALLVWAVNEGFRPGSTRTYRDYLAARPGLREDALVQMVGELEALGYLCTFGGGLDEQPVPSTKADVYVDRAKAKREG